MAKETVRVSICGQTYSLITDEPVQHVQQAAALVDKYMSDGLRAGNQDAAKVAMFVALQLASDVLHALDVSQVYKQEQESWAERIKEQYRILSQVI